MDSFTLITILLIVLIMLLIFKFIHIDDVHTSDKPEKKEMHLNPKQKRLIARWFNSHESPDHDGYLGHYVIPASVMDVYRKLYSGEWD